MIQYIVIAVLVVGMLLGWLVSPYFDALVEWRKRNIVEKRKKEK